MRAGIKEGSLIVELPISTPRRSDTGKMDIIAGGGGFAALMDVKGNQLAIGDRGLKINCCAGFQVNVKPKPVCAEVKAVHDTAKGVLRLSLPMSAEGTPSATGKMLLHAKTPGGWVNTGLLIDGREVQVNLTVGVTAPKGLVPAVADSKG